ncbi:MAG: NAD(+)--rifampin ADP-ribosyltransferase [Saprospiraceae bacterium]|nr:NAD(+)--rifampin ADP-ribosyltransferase [Saprospiraceae bacterium]
MVPTKANLKQGDLIEPGFHSNYGKKKKASYVYLSATLDAAIWGAELALGEGPGRIYTSRRHKLCMTFARARGIMPQSRKSYDHNLTACGIYCRADRPD